MTEQNRKYITKEIGKLLSETWRIKGPGGAGVRAAASDNEKADQHARGCAGITTREIGNRRIE